MSYKMKQIVDIVIIFLGLFVVPQVLGSGKLKMLLLRYENEEGTGDNGNYCDGNSFYHSSDCDQYFKVCVDRASGDDSIVNCAIGFIETGNVHNVDSFDFTDDIGGTPNPLTFEFNHWTMEGIKLKISVWDDDDSNDDDHVDDLSITLPIVPDISESTAMLHEVEVEARTKLTMALTLYCDAHWYGADCSLFCLPRDSSSLGHYECSSTGVKICHDGWQGLNCEQETDECASSPCLNGGICEDHISEFTCQCTERYYGLTCEGDHGDPCLSGPCQNGASCSSVGLQVHCTCAQGFTGSVCEVNIDDCEGAACQNGGVCVDGVNSYGCSCTDEYTGTQCETDKCAGINCMNGGYCDVIGGIASCVCVAGFTGSVCDVNIDDCDTAPCLNGGVCVDGVNSYSCSCTDEYTGTQCETDKCAGINCMNGGYCDVISGAASCVCVVGFTGTTCENKQEDRHVTTESLDSCFPSPCLNNGTCHELRGDMSSSFVCVCPDGYIGDRCEDVPTSDFCTGSPCGPHGTCVSQGTGYTCQCQHGWQGEQCEQDPCNNVPCNQGECLLIDGAYSCQCTSGYTGPVCDTKIPYCTPNICLNGGSCKEGDSAYHCLCAGGYTGTNCQHLRYVEDPTRSSLLMFRGTLNDEDIKDLKKSLIQLVAEKEHAKTETLTLDSKVNFCPGDNGQDISLFEFRILDDHEDVIPWYTLEDIFSDLKQRDRTGVLGRIISDGTRCDGTQAYARLGAASSNNKPTWEPWKLTVGLIIGAVVIGLIIVGIIAYRKRRNRQMYEVGTVSNPLFEARESNASYNDGGKLPPYARCHSQDSGRVNMEP